MKLYIKVNNINILRNLNTLLPNANSKAKFYIDKNSNNEYIINLKSAEILKKHSKTLFYEDKKLNNLVKGIYFGNSYCEHLIPRFTDIIEAKEICEKNHYNFVFVFPPLSNFKTKEAIYILKYLAKQKQKEVVVNDIGTLYLALEYNLKPILGINFTKTIKNAFINAIKPTDLSQSQFENQKKLLSHLEFEISDVREFYKKIGVGRFSIENLDFNLEFLDKSPTMQCDFYYPFITLTNSKSCDIAGLFDDKRNYFVHKDCPKYCNFASLEFNNTNILDLHQRYNVVYKTNLILNIPKILYKNSRNRFIWEIFL
jgi:hypothetical protein